MKNYTYKLKFEGPLHLGDGKLDTALETFCADTLFSALCVEAVKGGNDCLQKFIEYVKKDEIRISDAFPYSKDTLYLPKPIKVIENVERKSDSVSKKAFKKLKYLPADLMSEYLNGKIDILNKEIVTEFGVYSQKVQVSKAYEIEPKPYNVKSFSFYEGNGLYVIVSMKDEVKVLFDELLKALSFDGIGGKRSIGYGRFSFSCEASTVNIVLSPSKEAMSLSISLPKENELITALDSATYMLIRRSGFVDNSATSKDVYRKQDIYMLTSGSCFANGFEGDIYDVSLGNGNHPVYRYGKPLFMEI